MRRPPQLLAVLITESLDGLISLSTLAEISFAALFRFESQVRLHQLKVGREVPCLCRNQMTFRSNHPTSPIRGPMRGPSVVGAILDPSANYERCWRAAAAWLSRWWGDCCWHACFIASSPPINTRPAPGSQFVPRLPDGHRRHKKMEGRRLRAPPARDDRDGPRHQSQNRCDLGQAGAVKGMSEAP